MDDKIIYSKRIKAGKRTYFLDIKSTNADDFYITVTESKRRLRPSGDFFYEKHKIFLYKEDFNKFLQGMTSAIDYVKTELLPDYDFSKFDQKDEFSTETEQMVNEENSSEENNHNEINLIDEADNDDTRLKWE